MNSAEQSRFHLQALLARGLAIPEARERLGVTGVSEIWGGVEPRDKPGWYVWMSDRPGAFELDLEAAEPAEVDQAQSIRAQLSVRYYPAATEEAFRSFCQEEREIVTGGWLDRTGAPDVMRGATIPSPLFVIGALELTFDTDHQRTRAVTLGARDRVGAVPAWELAHPLFTAIVGFVAQGERRSALRLVETSDVSHRSAVVIFDPTASCRHELSDYIDEDAHVVRDETLATDTRIEPAPASRSAVRIASSWFAQGAPPPVQLGCCR